MLFAASLSRHLPPMGVRGHVLLVWLLQQLQQKELQQKELFLLLP